MTANRLNELMHEHYSYLSYDKSEAQNYLDCGGYTGTDDDMAAWLFADYLVAQDLCEVNE